MPQQLKIEVDGDTVGCLASFSTGETRYSVRLSGPEIEEEVWAHGLETGVRRRPEEPDARGEDFLNDFVHARRAIAAARAASGRFLEHLEESRPPGPIANVPLTIRLLTNGFDRGRIRIEPFELGHSVAVKLVIGTGPCRVPKALPDKASEIDRRDCSLGRYTTHTARALKVLRSVGRDLEALLAEHAEQPSSGPAYRSFRDLLDPGAV